MSFGLYNFRNSLTYLESCISWVIWKQHYGSCQIDWTLIYFKIQPVWGTSSSKKNVKSKKSTFYSESESGSESGKDETLTLSTTLNYNKFKKSLPKNWSAECCTVLFQTLGSFGPHLLHFFEIDCKLYFKRWPGFLSLVSIFLDENLPVKIASSEATMVVLNNCSSRQYSKSIIKSLRILTVCLRSQGKVGERAGIWETGCLNQL